MNVTSGGEKLRANSSDYSLHVAGPQLWASALLSRIRKPFTPEQPLANTFRFPVLTIGDDD